VLSILISKSPLDIEWLGGEHSCQNLQGPFKTSPAWPLTQPLVYSDLMCWSIFAWKCKITFLKTAGARDLLDFVRESPPTIG
jgi:hypothetical protein